jgi:hypothetical protein
MGECDRAGEAGRHVHRRWNILLHRSWRMRADLVGQRSHGGNEWVLRSAALFCRVARADLRQTRISMGVDIRARSASSTSPSRATA